MRLSQTFAPEGASRAAAVAGLAEETLAAFDWLAEGLERRQAVAFFPNPGNIGDAAINLACWRYLLGRFDRVTIAKPGERLDRQHVFVGGGGNLVEPLYDNLRAALGEMGEPSSLRLFPSTIVGNSALLDGFGDRLRVVAREEKSFGDLCENVNKAAIRIGHDAVFASGPEIADFAATRPVPASGTIGVYRADREAAQSRTGGLDVMAQANGVWADLGEAERWRGVALRYLAGFSEITTDRLHGAILAALLGRQVVLHPNAYFKNAAVFRHSLSRLPNVRFAGDPDHWPWPLQ